MAEPIRIYTPQREVQKELQHKLENAPLDHAEAVLATYELLQEAQDHGVLDTLRGAIGAGDMMIGKISEYTNTPEGVRLLRNLLAATRLLGELDPVLLSSAAKALSGQREGSDDASVWRSLQRLASKDSRRALAAFANFSQTFGRAQSREASAASSKGAAVPIPLVAVALGAVFASFWFGRRSVRR